MSGTKANDMSDVLGEVFNTKVASATPEDLEKQAQVQFFNGLCKEQGIDVKELTDPQIDQLWKVAMEMRKEAGDMPPQFAKKDGDDKEGKKPEEKKPEDKEKEAAAAKVAAAEAEFNEKRAAAVKIAEADAMGRIMAHSFVEELGKIAEKGGGLPFPPKKEGDDKGDDKDKDKDKDGKKEASAAEKVAALVTAFQSKTAGAAPAADGSSTPNFDEQAAYHAIELLKQAGVDAEVAFSKVNAAYTLGLKESVKLASAPDVKAGLEIRALEICEAAGFPVNWT